MSTFTEYVNKKTIEEAAAADKDYKINRFKTYKQNGEFIKDNVKKYINNFLESYEWDPFDAESDFKTIGKIVYAASFYVRNADEADDGNLTEEFKKAFKFLKSKKVIV